MVGKVFAEIKVIYVERLPLPKCTRKEQDEVASLARQILAAKRADAGADTSALEAEIDRHVYALYGLTPAEIKIVEESSAPKATVT